MTMTEKFKVTLGQYKGLTSKKPSAEFTDEEFAQVCRQQQINFAQKLEVKNRPVKNGDIAVIDFAGYCGGEAFDGGSGTDYPLEIGSGAFIPGFEEQLIGASLGEEVDVNVVFPEDYGAPNLAGRPALFKVKVKKIEEVHLPELDDAVKKDIRKKYAQQKEMNAEADYESLLLLEIISDSEIVIEDSYVELEAGNMVEEWKAMLKMRGLDPVRYYEMTGMTDEKMKEQFKDQALLRMQSRLVLDAIAQTEDITVSEFELEAEMEAMAKRYEITRAELKERIGEEHIQAFTSDARMKKTLMFIKEHAEPGKDSGQ